MLWDNDNLNQYEFDVTPKGEKLFEVGKQFPPQSEIERLAKYKRGTKLYDGHHREVFNRAKSLFNQDESQKRAEQLDTLYMACNVLDIIVSQPADMMFGEPPLYESTKAPDSREQKALDKIVRNNRLNVLGHEVVTGAGYRGDSFVKTYFDYQQDVSELPYIPDSLRMEPIIEAQDPSTVFPELARGSKKKFKAINIAYVEYQKDPIKGTEIPYLYVERHVAGFIEYSRFRMTENGPEGYSTQYGVGIPTFRIVEHISSELEETGTPQMLIKHIPYKTTDDRWQGISTVEKVEELVGAVNDRLNQIDYVLFKHTDPNMYGPNLDEASTLSSGGKYIPVEKDEVTPAYMVWNSQLDGAFKEIEMLTNMIFQISETPQWLFGTTLSEGNQGGTGTSHTDGAGIKARFMPILTKTNRTRIHVDYAFKDAIENAMYLDNVGNEGVEEFDRYTPIQPHIAWKDGLPENEKEQAEIMNLRTGGRQTMDVRGAIKKMDDVSDEAADEILSRIEEDEEKDETVGPDIFNEETAHVTDEAAEDEGGDE